MFPKNPRRDLLRQAEQATSYTHWFDIASRLDTLDGHDEWLEQENAGFYDASLMRQQMADMATARTAGNWRLLEATVTESMFRNLPDIAAAPLYQFTHTGRTQRIVGLWLAECERALEALRDAPMPAADAAQRIQRFAQALKNAGRSSLLLSGGGAWGLYHLGVVRALRRANLLPSVLCGSSMGAIIASGVATRTLAELDAMMDDPQTIHRVAVRLQSPGSMVRNGSVLSAAQLREHVEQNVGGLTFAEAYQRTGLVLNVTVSPTRARQKPRVLSHQTAPDVLVADATIASCSLPALFPPVQLRARTSGGQIVPYLENETWLDGSLRGDLPLQRLARLHNVNHFIVSQANPFVLPFVSMRHHGPVRSSLRFAGSLVRAQTAAVIDEARQHVHAGVARNWMDTAHALFGQPYHGDITVHPRVMPQQYLKVMANPSLAELNEYIRGGQRATWPWLEMIRHQTLLERTLQRCVDTLRQRGVSDD
jgi:NTE family protein